MKKSMNALFVVTFLFIGLIVGVFIGRNTRGTWITLEPSPGHTVSDTEPAENATPGKVNINTAGIRELTLLPGIGNTKAEAIIEFREAFGKFTSIEDLVYVNGFSFTMIEQLRPYITVGG